MRRLKGKCEGAFALGNISKKKMDFKLSDTKKKVLITWQRRFLVYLMGI